MENIRDIKDRIKSVREIHKITRAMKMVATAKYKKIQRKLERTGQYVAELEAMMALLKKDVVERYNPFFAPARNGGKELVVVVTSDRGLCGAFNTNLIRFGADQLSRADVYVIGKKGVNILKRQPDVSIIATDQDVFTHPDFKIYCRIAETIKYHYLTGKYAAVKVLYTGYESMGRQPLELKQLFPICDAASQEPTEQTTSDPEDTPSESTEDTAAVQRNRRVSTIFEPDPEQVFTALVNHYIDVCIQQIMEQSYLSEQIIRMNAMDAATTNAEELINSLLLVFNRARQSVITTEILEIVGGAEALKA